MIEFFYTDKDRIKRRKEKIHRINKMRYNQSILKRIEKAKEKEKDLANYGACVSIGGRRRLGDASANAIKNYEVLCNECADNVLPKTNALKPLAFSYGDTRRNAFRR
ncbi:hypothetical protein KVB95_05150 [Helicobacter pylori]|nr:hypothetical protein KVB95_05150 [Helicobacter pylori]